MGDLPLDEKNANPNPVSGEVEDTHTTTKKEVPIEPKEPTQIQIMEGNTGTMTVKFLEAIAKQNGMILDQLKEMNFYLSKGFEKEKPKE